MMQDKFITGRGTLRGAKRPTGYHLGMYIFRTKQAVQDAIKALLAGCQVGSILRPEDEALMLDVLQYHPHARGENWRGYQAPAYRRTTRLPRAALFLD